MSKYTDELPMRDYIEDKITQVWGAALDVLQSKDFKSEVKYMFARKKVIDRYTDQITQHVLSKTFPRLIDIDAVRYKWEEMEAIMKKGAPNTTKKETKS